jgi:hypothetical protein
VNASRNNTSAGCIGTADPVGIIVVASTTIAAGFNYSMIGILAALAIAPAGIVQLALSAGRRILANSYQIIAAARVSIFRSRGRDC